MRPPAAERRLHCPVTHHGEPDGPVLLDRTYAAPAQARRHLLRILPTMRIGPETTDSLVVIASELVTNALQHGTDGKVRLALKRDGNGDGVTMTVADDSPYRPLPAAGDPGWGESGRGLLIVAALTARWGHRPAYGCCRYGTAVWARLEGVRR